MKTRIVVFFFSIVLIAWSCGSKTESAANETVISGDTVAVDVGVITEEQQANTEQTIKEDENVEVMEADVESAIATSKAKRAEGLVRLTEAQKEKNKKMQEEVAKRIAQRKRIAEERAKISPTYTDKEGNLIYNMAEVNPQFDGGEKALKKYLRKNLKYPADAEEQQLEGTVFVDFVVTSNGTVREVEVTENTNETVMASLRAEAVRVISGMPRWQPGRQNGKTVGVRYSLPITFRLL